MTDFRKTSTFNWTEPRMKAVLALAEGKTQKEAAEEAGVTDRTIRSWLIDPAFSEELDRLSLMVGIASRAERLRIAQRVARQMVRDDGTVATEKDLLEWLKFAQSETNGIKLDLAALNAVATSVADSGSD